MKKLKQQLMVLCMQQKQWENKVEEMQDEAKRVYDIIQLVYEILQWQVQEARHVPSKHLSFDLVENLQKVEEDMRHETMKVVKILQYFQGHVSTSKDMEK